MIPFCTKFASSKLASLASWNFFGCNGTTGRVGMCIPFLLLFSSSSSPLFSSLLSVLQGWITQKTNGERWKEWKKSCNNNYCINVFACLLALVLLLSTAAKRSFKAQYSSIFMCVCVCVLLFVLLFCFDLLTLLFSVSSFLCNLVFNLIVLPFQLCQL